MPGFDQVAVDRLARYCIDHHKAANDKDLGAPISRETMLEVADWTCSQAQEGCGCQANGASSS